MYVLASGQYSMPSLSWQQQASIFLPVSVQIRPDSDKWADLADAASSSQTAVVLNNRIPRTSVTSNIRLPLNNVNLPRRKQ
jgi:hypothetical protein